MGSTDVILPEGTTIYSWQVAGHEYDGKSKLGVLKHENGYIIKPVKENDHRAESELRFYENVFSKKESDPILKELTSFLPKFCGTCQKKVGAQEMKFLCLEDVCETFKNPTILDIKIGGKTYDPDANEAKILYEKSKYAYSEIVGFRILGMKIYCEEQNIYINKDKKFGKQVTPENLRNALELLLTSNVYLNCLILSGFLHQLVQLAAWFKKQRKFAFYSSSLLFVHEGTSLLWYEWIKNNFRLFSGIENSDPSAFPSCLVHILQANTCETQCKTCLLNSTLCHRIKSSCDLIRVAIIDCAHVFPTSDEDTNYTFGLENLIAQIQIIFNAQKKLAFMGTE